MPIKSSKLSLINPLRTDRNISKTMNTIVANNGIVNGILELEDDFHEDAFKDDYLLVGFTPGETIVLELRSNEFDTWLQVINSDTGEVIAANDDDLHYSTWNSLLDFITEENVNYLVRVTGHDSSETGNYTLISNQIKTEPDADLVITDAEVTVVNYKQYYDKSYILSGYLNVTVNNLGLDPATLTHYYPTWQDALYLSSDENLDPAEDDLINRFSGENTLAAGDSYTISEEIYSSINNRDLDDLENSYLIFVTDYYDIQYETNENNNTFTIPINIDNIINGNNWSDTFYGYIGNDILYGGDGNDTLNGGLGADILNGGNNDDSLLGVYDHDILNGGDGNDTLYGGYGHDILNGGLGADYLSGDFGNDILYGKNGNDTLNGGVGADYLWGDKDDDRLSGGDGNDTLNGGNGNDTLYGGYGHDALNGGLGADYLQSNFGNNTLNGGNGNDTLYGGVGDDTLIGGDGLDILFGGAGSDYFRLASTTFGNRDVIEDFEDGIDLIELSGNLSFGALTITESDSNTNIIETATTETIAILQNINASEIDLNDFI